MNCQPNYDADDLLNAGQRRILEMIATAAPLSDVLTAVCQLIERCEPELLCSILLPHDDGRGTGLAYGAALPATYLRGLEGIVLSTPDGGSCCDALSGVGEVVTTDMVDDDRWSPEWRDLNLQHGLRACRAIPIFSSDGQVLGAASVLRREPGDPGATSRETLAAALHLAGIAVERARAVEREQRLQTAAGAANAQFRGFFEQGMWLAAIVALDGRVLEANKLALDACGYTAEPVVGQYFWEGPWWAQSPELVERIKAAVLAGAAGEPYRAEVPYYMADGSERATDFSLIPITDADGRVMFLAPTGTDITDRKRAETRLRRSEERMRLLWEAAAVLLTTDEPDAMLHRLFAKIGPSLRLDTYFNFMVNDLGSGLKLASCTGIPDETAKEIENLAFGQAICGTVALLRRPIVSTFIQESDDPKAALVKSFGIRAYACNPLMAEEKLLGTLSFASRSRDQFDAEELDFLQTICQYVTAAYERLRLINELQAADRRKDEFLATLAHELRNPLAPLRNGLQVIKLAKDDVETADVAREMMERQLGQMVRLIDDLLDLSRISRGKVELRKERVELAQAVQQAVETSRPVIEQAGHDLTITLPPDPIYVDADVTRLAQVFANLLNNAAKYTERGGRVRLCVERQGSDAVVAVKDNGVGIPAAMLPRVFDIFTQVDRSLEKAQGGLGIGLSLVKWLVEMHGGNVEARSDGHGLGSEFVVRLPLLITPSVVPEPHSGDFRRPTIRRKILVVDDNRDSATSLALLLQFMGHETRTAHDGLEAIDAAEIFMPELVLLDIGMPKLNGYDAARRIRATPWGKGMTLIALTGWGQEEDRQRSHDAGFDAHIVKPVDLAAIERALASLPTPTI